MLKVKFGTQGDWYTPPEWVPLDALTGKTTYGRRGLACRLLPKKDERPWYQKVRLRARRRRREGRGTDTEKKNWMFLMAITMLVLNILTPEPPKQQGGQQGGQRR